MLATLTHNTSSRITTTVRRLTTAAPKNFYANTSDKSHSLSVKVEGDGDGPPLLLINGWAGVGADWGGLPKLLSANSRPVITYDPRGLGSSIKLNDDVSKQSTTTMASDARDVVKCYFDAVGIEEENEREIDVMGISMGGMVAMEMTTVYNVRKLILGCTTPGGSKENPPAHPPKDGKFFGVFNEWANDGLETDKEIASEFLLKVLGESHCSTRTGKIMHGRMVERFVEGRAGFGENGGAGGVIAQLPALKFFDGTPILKQALFEEALIMHGMDDGVVPFGNAVVMKELIGEKARVEEMEEGSGHFFFITKAKETVEKIDEFLKN